MEDTSILRRRSTRKFEDRPVEKEKIERILRAAMQAPSAKNTQSWEFLVVTDRAACEAIANVSPYTVCAAQAPAILLPLANLQRDDPETPWWVQNLSAATENLLLQAEEEGLGAVWLGVYPLMERVRAVRQLFALPDHIMPFAAVPIGYKLREKTFDDRYDPEKVHWEHYGQSGPENR